MTVEELKKLDGRVRKIQYPFGENYLIVYKIFQEAAEQQDVSMKEIVQFYTAWKRSN